MNKDRTTEILDYLEGRLPEAERRQLEADLSASPELRQELDSLRRMLVLMDETVEEQPSSRLREGFYHFLSDQETEVSGPGAPESSKTFRLPWQRHEWSIAAAVALIIIGMGFGVLWHRNLDQQEQIKLLVNEVKQTRKMMVLTMLEQNSASERIKALNVVQRERPGPDPQIIEALINRLNTDDNVNVRLKAAESLQTFGDHPGVIEALIRSLGEQPYPEVQIALIDALVSLRAKDAVNEFQQILEKEGSMDVVRNRAASGISQLM